MMKKTLWMGIFCASLLALASCGSKDKNTSTTTAESSSETTQTVADTTTPEKGKTGGKTTVMKANPLPPKSGRVKGIYLTQYTLENTALLNYLIKNAKEVGIDTFIIDLELPTKRYASNIKLVHDNRIKYVARIIMFPDGGTPEKINNPKIWQKKNALVQQAINWGASEIQLDYIRFNTKQKPSPENAKKIFNIIAWYKDQVRSRNVPLQIDVFGVTSFGESKYIGQNIKLFSQSVDAICPMVYPSHYVPFPEHFKTPYETVLNSLQHIKKQFGDPMPMKVYAYIELSNYHYPMTRAKTLDYIKAQIKAVKDANADGWYAWSPHNRYDNLFTVLKDPAIH